MAHAGQSPFPELLSREARIPLNVLSHRLDQLAAQVIGQSCILHLPGDLLHPLSLTAEEGFCTRTQLVLEGALEVSSLAGSLDGPGQALADM